MNPKIILLVEDSPSDIGLTQRALVKCRIANQLVVAEDGQEALNYLFASGKHTGRDVSNFPAMVLLDLKLPGIDGLEVLRQIRLDPRTSRLPVVILTSSKEEQDVAQSYDLGANSYIRKPVDFTQFALAVEHLGLYWLVLNETAPPKRGMSMTKPLAVLIVEDMESDALLIVREFTKAGYTLTFERVETAAQMRGALEKQAWEMVISDFSMPELDGHAALKILQESGLDIPMIIVSGIIGEETAVTMMKEGAHDYVMKGNLARLVPAVERELIQAEVRRERKRAESQREAALEALRTRVLQHLTILQTAMDGFWLADMQGRLLEVNETYCRMSGYTEQELLGMRIPDLESVEAVEDTAAHMQKVIAQGEDRFESRHRRKDGSIFDVEISVQFRPEEGGRFVVFLQDITKRKQAEYTLRKQNQLLSALQDTTLELVSQLDLKILLENIVKRACALVGTSAGLLDLVDPVTNQLIPQVGVGALEVSLNIPVQPGEGLSGIVWQTGEMLIIPDYDEWVGRLGGFSHGTLSSVIGVPLLAGTRVVGVLGIGFPDTSPHHFDPEDIEILNQFVRLATVAVQNARLFSDLQTELTDRKQAERFIKEIITKNPMSIQVLDKEGYTLEANPAHKLLFGSVPPADYSIFNDLQLAQKGMGEIFDQLRNGEVVHFPDVNFNPHDSISEMPDVPVWVRTIGFSLNESREKPERFILMHENITERKKAEHALRESNELLSLFIKNSPIYAFIKAVTPSEGRILNASDNFQDMVGIPAAEMVGKTNADLFPPVIAAKFSADDWAVVANGVVLKQEEDLNGRNYTTIKFPIIQGDKTLLAGYTIDITERKQTEEEIRMQSEQLRMLYEASQRLNRTLNLDEIYQTLCEFLSANIPNDSFAISAFDPATKLITCRAYWMENKWLDVSSFPPIPLEEEGRGTQSIAIRTGQPLLVHDYLAQMKTARTSYYVNSETNEVEREVSAEEHDITRSALIVPLKIGGLVSGVIQVMSYRLSAFTENQLKLLEALALHISSAEQNARLFAQVQTELNQRAQAEEQVRQLNAGLEQRIEARTRELRDTQAQLVLREKLAVLGQIAGSVAHELRNPIGVINNAIYYLKIIQPEANDKIKQYYGMIDHEVHNAKKIITDLLDFAQGVSADREKVSVAELVQRVLQQRPIPPFVEVTLGLPDDMPDVYADPSQLEQVLGNLVLNAYQAMAEGGQLSVSGGQLSVSGMKWVWICVKDTGNGITTENMRKLFEPLFTTKLKGIGLGLAVSKKLIEANGGRIEVQSEVGKGSKFTVFLPVQKIER